MDEETAIINTNTRNQKIKDFLLKNKKNLITISVIIVVLLVSYFSYNEIKKYNKSKLAEKYNQIILSYDSSNKEKIINKLAYIIDEKDTTYSPLALYFLLDNNNDFIRLNLSVFQLDVKFVINKMIESMSKTNLLLKRAISQIDIKSWIEKISYQVRLKLTTSLTSKLDY